MKRRLQRTVVSVSLAPSTLRELRNEAKKHHGGNLSAAVEAAAEALRRQIARDEVSAELFKGKPPLTDAQRRAIDAELEEGWAHARRVARRRSSAA
jgi:hypothetical protein